MVNRAAVPDTGKEIAAEFSEKNVTFMAAGIAYNAFLSLAPILVVLLVVVSTVGGGLEQRVVELSQESLPGPIADIVAEVFQGGAGDPAASVVGFIVLIWGTLKIFRGLDTAFSEIYETTAESSFTGKLVDGLIVLAAVVVAIVATIGVTALFARLANVIPYIGMVTPLVLVFGLVAAFLPMYYRFPDTDVGWRYVVPGAAFAAVGWAAFQALFQVYLTFTGGSSDSLFGGVVVVITWLYFSGLVLLAGAVINAVLGGHTTEKVDNTEAADDGDESAAAFETRLKTEMNADEFAAYLHNLRAALAGSGGEKQSTTGADDADRYPGPDDSVTVTEQSKSEDDERELSITLRWQATVDESKNQADITDD
ncbi:YihY/virulence factor BrkB family protein [Natronococcus pandeyae]|uniref:YihY/virulence factor BrkB family protein n=1 Tax=Natronococcus pandeyae TaxID=2055836 RepID=A0A8J8Q028_9EURY|nr:YihY/virulence factor BrkB family protein [Natronococcus pandeyae]TYL37991.1 YihY/virulence factor BrkB family protein [Natronococcus pandeyae]